MFNFLKKKKDLGMSKEDIAELLKTNPEALAAFERAYEKEALDKISDNMFEVNAKQAAETKTGIVVSEEYPQLDDIINRIVEELIDQTVVYTYDGKNYSSCMMKSNLLTNPVTKEEIMALPEHLRPQFTGSMMQIDVDKNSSAVLLEMWKNYLDSTDPEKKMNYYHHFRQGLDILDYDPLMYEMIDTNPNSMGHWLPALAEGTKQQKFFQIPKTKLIKVPMPILQMTRIGYENLTRTTLDIIDRYCYRVFGLNENEEYFIKTGTYSSKFDFRNARVWTPKEVRELGEYLLYIHYQANMMASPLNNRSIYGVSTTTEWVVREFIQDKDLAPRIYKGLPLHTEYRVFVDFDTKNVIGMNPYWDPIVMLQRFSNEEDSDSPHNVHDYFTYKAHSSVLEEKYDTNKYMVGKKVQELIQNMDLSGQWSIDVMQNGEDFWIIDMALAQNSAYYDECVPKELRVLCEENWLPKIG